MVEVQADSIICTAKDIAEAIAFKDRNGFTKALRQVKHWTNSGLLETLNDVETGTGISREYVAEPTILIAAVLQELTLFGLTVETLRPIAKQLFEDAEQGDPYDLFAAADIDDFKGYLALDFDVNNKGKLRVAGIRCVTAGATGRERDLKEADLPQTTSSIMIDIAALNARITLPTIEDQVARVAA